jgi:hypothetical protein
MSSTKYFWLMVGQMQLSVCAAKLRTMNFNKIGVYNEKDLLGLTCFDDGSRFKVGAWRREDDFDCFLCSFGRNIGIGLENDGCDDVGGGTVNAGRGMLGSDGSGVKGCREWSLHEGGGTIQL